MRTKTRRIKNRRTRNKRTRTIYGGGKNMKYTLKSFRLGF